MAKLLLLLCASVTLVSSSAFSETLITSEIFVGGSAVGQSFSPSNHVTISADVDPANGYILYSWHSSGNRYFGTDNKSNTMYWQDAATVTRKSLAEHIGANHLWPSPWKAL